MAKEKRQQPQHMHLGEPPGEYRGYHEFVLTLRVEAPTYAEGVRRSEALSEALAAVICDTPHAWVIDGRNALRVLADSYVLHRRVAEARAANQARQN